MTATTPLATGFATIGQGAGPMMVTWKAGLFTKHGLDIGRPRLMGGAKGVVRGLMAGEIQFGNLAAPAPLRANLKGEADVVFLTGGINQQFVIGRPGLNSRTELAGKKIGTVADGGIGDALVKFVIAKLSAAGINGLREEPIPHGAAAELEALLNGTVDAVVGTPPECIDAIRHGCKYLIDFGEYGLNYALGGIAARRDYVEKNPEIARKFVKAYVEGMHRYRTDREFTVDVQADSAALPIAPSRQKPMISHNPACRAHPIRSSRRCKLCSISWPTSCRRRRVSTRKDLSTSASSESSKTMALSIH
jgi:ABC-type nitrate/sulfonate/bicarbonate transport system substrate-binding protein